MDGKDSIADYRFAFIMNYHGPGFEEAASIIPMMNSLFLHISTADIIDEVDSTAVSEHWFDKLLNFDPTHVIYLLNDAHSEEPQYEAVISYLQWMQNFLASARHVVFVPIPTATPNHPDMIRYINARIHIRSITLRTMLRGRNIPIDFYLCSPIWIHNTWARASLFRSLGFLLTRVGYRVAIRHLVKGLVRDDWGYKAMKQTLKSYLRDNEILNPEAEFSTRDSE